MIVSFCFEWYEISTYEQRGVSSDLPMINVPKEALLHELQIRALFDITMCIVGFLDFGVKYQFGKTQNLNRIG